jgi:hypothetical protein
MPDSLLPITEPDRRPLTELAPPAIYKRTCRIDHVQSSYDAWRSADELAHQGLVAASDVKKHEDELLLSICPSGRSAELKIMVALHCVRKVIPVGDDRNWDMIESALGDMVAGNDPMYPDQFSGYVRPRPDLPALAVEWLSACKAVDGLEETDEETAHIWNIEQEINLRPETSAECLALRTCTDFRSLRVSYDNDPGGWDDTSQTIEAMCQLILKESFGDDFDLSFLFRWWRDRGAIA